MILGPRQGVRAPCCRKAQVAVPRSRRDARHASVQPGPRWPVPSQQGCKAPSRLVATRAIFDGLSRGLERAWDIVRKDGKLTPENVKEPMREIRRALLEADVSLPVVRGFIKKVETEAMGIKVIPGVTPDQQLVKVVYDQLLDLIGSSKADLNGPAKAGEPQVILLAGLQGVGKTTACGKLAMFLKKEGKRVLMVSTDVYRPAAIDQLEVLSEKVAVDFLRLPSDGKPPAMAAEALQKAMSDKYDVLLVDTAGRLQVDDSMMTELRDIQKAVTPSDTLLVVDAMTGQEAAMLTKSFNDAVGITGAILTKMDGDSRGGAALSVKAVSGQPIKFVGTGEKMDSLEPFYPDRMAGRILGMGDVLTLVEKAQEAIKEEDAMAMVKKMLAAKFDYNDFLNQYKTVTGMGGLGAMVKMLPGMNQLEDKQLNEVEKKYKVYEAIIGSMTAEERSNPDLLAKQASRRRRIAKGSGRSDKEVSELLATFTQMRAQMKTMSKMMAAAGGGFAGMDDEEMMQAVMDGIGASTVTPGMVRRKRALKVGKKLGKKQPVLAATSKGFGG